MSESMSQIEKIFSSRLRKFFLFLFSYLTASSLMCLFMGSITYIFYSAAFFPAGFGWPILKLDNASFQLNLTIGRWFYLIITFFTVFVSDGRAAKILYLIFVFFLILNIGGCINSDIRVS